MESSIEFPRNSSGLSILPIARNPVSVEVAKLGNRELLTWFHRNGANLAVKDEDGLGIVSYLTELGFHGMAAFVADRLQ